MFKNTSKFQIIFMGVFIALTVIGLLFFSLYNGGSKNESYVVTIWGTADGNDMHTFTESVAQQTKNKIRVMYVEKNPDTFDTDLLEALATGKGPDALLLSQNSLLKNSNKIYQIPYKTLPEVTFKNTYIQEAELFLAPQGVLAVPFSIDPMVMYWNRDMFSNAAITLPPKYWDEFYTLSPLLTKKDDSANISQSAVALGEYQNIKHAKDILALLMIQAGNPLVVKSSTGYQSTLNSNFNQSIAPANSALTFYTQFADPRKAFYSWNRGLRPDDAFLFQSNKVGLYFGYASEYQQIKEKNPNLNFDVTYVPQIRPQQGVPQVSTTMGNLYGFSILKASKNIKATYDAINTMTSKDNIDQWSKQTSMPSVRRDVLSYTPSDAASAVFSTSAIWSHGWLDPDTKASDDIYKNMVESITSGRSQYAEALLKADQQLRDLLNTVNSK